MGVWLLFLVLLAGMIAVGVWMWQQDQKRRQALATFALNRGWTYAPSDDSWVERWTGPPFGQGDHRHARNVMTGTLSGEPLVAFDYSFQTHSTDGKGNTTTTTHRYAVCALHLPAYLPRLQVTPENLFTRFGNALGLDDIELESEDFNRRFRVHANDPKFASDVLSPRTMQTLLSRPAFSWRIDGADIVSWQNGRLTPTDLLMAASTMSSVMAGIPSFVWRDHGYEPGAAATGGTPA